MAKSNRSKPSPRAHPRPKRSARHLRVLAGAALIVAAVWLAYSPSLSGGFILDDNLLLTDSPLIKAPDGLYRIWVTTEAVDYWPVSNSSLWLEWRLWGMHPTGYHVTNLALHIVVVCLLWVILEQLSIPSAFLAALLFAVHPVNVETVAWIAQRKSLLAMLFSLLSIFLYLNAESHLASQSRPAAAVGRWYSLSLVAFVLAMLSKVSVAMLPLLLLWIVWWGRSLTRRDLVRIVPFLLAAAVLLGVNVWFRALSTESPIRTAQLTERLLGAGSAIWFYLYKALLPLNLVFIYPQWHVQADQFQWWLPLLAAVGTTCVLWHYRRGWSRPLLFAWGCFCLALAPVLGFTDVGFKQPLLVADHYQYTALAGIVALVAAGWSTWQQHAHGPARWASSSVAVALGSVLTLLTWQQAKLYASPLMLYQATVVKNPESWIAHHDLGLALFQEGHFREAIAHYQQAVRLKPNYPQYQYDLGTALAHAGQRQEAIGYFQEALRLEPDYADAHNNLGGVLFEAGRAQEAIEHYESALRLKPDFPEAHYGVGRAQFQTGQLREAIEHFRQTLRFRPDYSDAHNDLGAALVDAGRFAEAIGHFRQALRLRPDDVTARHNLEQALAMQQKAAERK